MPRQPGNRITQKVIARGNSYQAGRDINVYPPGGGGRAIPELLPRELPGFTGREDEVRQLTALAGGGCVMVTAIGGTAGVGKTALAVHAAYRLLSEFPDGRLYADLHGYTEGRTPEEPGKVLDLFLRSLGVAAEEIPAGMEERSGVLRGLLESRRVLMVLDNAATETQVEPLLPGAGNSLVLVTSRSVLPGLVVDERVSLDVLPRAEAGALLAGLIGEDRASAEPEAVAQVRDWCGGLPLALRIAGQILDSHPGWPVAKLERMLAVERDRLGRLAAGDLQVRAAFGVSYQHLAEGDRLVFRRLGLHPGPGFDAWSAAALTGIGPEEARLALGRLAEACLVTEEQPDWFEMHDLLRLFARETCDGADDQASRDAAEIRLVSYYAEGAMLLNACIHPQGRRVEEQAGSPLPPLRDALTAFEAERLSLLAAFELAIRQGQDELALQLGVHMGFPLSVLRYLDDLIVVMEIVLTVARRAGNILAESSALRSLGNTYGELSQFEEAISHFEQDIAIHRETGNRVAEGQTLNNLGVVYRMLRKFDEAISFFGQALAICRETGDRVAEGEILTNLGGVDQELRRFDEAVSRYEQSLAIYREIGERQLQGVTLINLGDTYRELRRFDEAIGCHEQSLTIYQEAGDWYREGMALTSLGGDYLELRRFDEAVRCYEESLPILQDARDRYREGTTLANLGNSYRELRRLREAIRCYEQSLTIAREIGNRYAESMVLTNFSAAYWTMRRFDDAISCLEQSLAISRDIGDRHGEGQTLNNLGNVYQKLRQPDQAAACWRDASVAMRDTGEHDEAARLERLAKSARSRQHRWRRRLPSASRHGASDIG